VQRVSIKRQSRAWAAATIAQTLSRIPARSASTEISPVFIVGCGRSGTTALGNTLGTHPEVRYLNEPRYLWRAIDPRTDIWRPRPRARDARLVLDDNDVSEMILRRARNIFANVYNLGRQRTLIEKLPANSARIPYLRALFPSARFIAIERDGRDVARSIAAIPTWFAAEQHFHWREVRRFALEAGFPAHFLDSDLTNFEKGLVEWTVMTNEVRRQLSADSTVIRHHVHYEDLVARPVEVAGELQSFLGLAHHEGFIESAQRDLSPRSADKTSTDGARMHDLTIDLLRNWP
jgi:hypothetical protein